MLTYPNFIELKVKKIKKSLRSILQKYAVNLNNLCIPIRPSKY